MLHLVSKYGILTQTTKYKCSDRFGVIVSQNKLIKCFALRVELTQFDVKWAISRKRGYSENVRKYYTLGFFFYTYLCSLYRYVIQIYAY